MLSAALRSASSQSLLGAAEQVQQQSSPVSNLLQSAHSLSSSYDAQDAQEDSVHSVNTVDRGILADHEAPELMFPSDEDVQFGVVSNLGMAMSSLAMVQEADNAPHRSPFAKPPHHPASDSSCYGSMAIPQRQASIGAPYGAPMARSCPKPILMPRRGSRQNSFTQDQDDLGVFVPPHEMVASSLMDPSNVAESLNRKGSAALRVRTGVLRRTGFYDGHTETLRANGSSFKA